MGTAAGVQQKFWVKTESTFDTVSSFVTTDAVDLIELKIEPSKEYTKRVSHVGTSSLQGEIAGMEGGTWSASTYVSTAAAGTAPDYGEILKAGFGTETVTGGTSVKYECSDSAAIGSLQLVKYSGDYLVEIANGAWVEQIEVEIPSGGGPAKITASGGFATYGFAAGGVVSGAHSTSETTITLATGDAQRLRPNVYVKFDSEDNSGSGYLVTAVDHDNDQITITPGLAGALSGSEVVAPNIPGQTIGGTVRSSTAGDLTVDSTSYACIDYKLTFKTGIYAREGEYTSSKPTGLFKGMREVEGEFSVFFEDTANGEWYGAAFDGDTHNMTARVGPSTAAEHLKIATPAARFEVTPIEVPEAEAATASVKFIARQSSAAGDEIHFMFD